MKTSNLRSIRLISDAFGSLADFGGMQVKLLHSIFNSFVTLSMIHLVYFYPYDKYDSWCI